MSFFDDLANAAAAVVNTIVQTFVPGAPPIPPPPVPPAFSDNTHGASSVNSPPPTGGTALPGGGLAPNNDRFIVLDLIDLLQKPPPKITSEYVKIVQRVSSWVGSRAQLVESSKDARNSWQLSLFPEQSAGAGFGPTLGGPDLTSQETVRNAVSKARNDVLSVATRIEKSIPFSLVFGVGFFPQDNPFNLAAGFNYGRLGFTAVQISDLDVSRIAGSMRVYLDILSRLEDRILLNQVQVDAAQLSSATLSLEGFGGSGNTSVDLGRLTPEQEAIKRQKALEALSVLDFKRRVPKVLFIAAYQPTAGRPLGIIVGLKRVPDASGYVITRRSIFDDKVVKYTVSNTDVKRDTDRLAEYVQTWVLSFYDAVQKDQVITFLDADYKDHRYYYYTVQAYQHQNTNIGSMFSVPVSPAPFSQAQKAEMRRQVSLLSPGDPTVVSPYPIISQQLFGSPDNDWLLAALNTRSSINRNEPRSQTRKYAYLSAQLEFLLGQADAGLFMVPQGRDFGPARKNVQDAISKFGVNQVIQNLLQETGAIYHFDGTEPNEDSLFTKIGTTDEDESALLLTVASAIDPETATLNMQTLASNMPAMMSGQVTVRKTKASAHTSKLQSVKSAKSVEIAVPGDVDGAPEVNVTSDIQFLQKLGNTSQRPVDLTQVDGLGVLMRAIRIYADLDANMGAPPITLTAGLLLPTVVAGPTQGSASGLPPAPPANKPPPRSREELEKERKSVSMGYPDDSGKKWKDLAAYDAYMRSLGYYDSNGNYNVY